MVVVLAVMVKEISERVVALVVVGKIKLIWIKEMGYIIKWVGSN